MLSRIYESMDKRKFFVCTIIHPFKAFSTLDWFIKKNSVTTKYAVKLSFGFSHTYHFVILHGIAASNGKVDLGAAQGSSLGPLLFNLFIIVLTLSTSFIYFFMYADSTSLVASSKNLHNLIVGINTGLSRVFDWFQLKKLTTKLK